METIEEWNEYIMENPLLKYSAFVKTVETGSFTKAADALQYAQSSVSKMIGDLESDWGVTLLERSRNGVTLTSAGEQLLPEIRGLLRDLEHLEGRISRINGLQTGIVRIGTFASVSIHWLPGILSAFQRDYPGIEYELLLGDYDEIERWIEEGRVDCGFLRLPTRPGFGTMLLEQDEYMLVLPKGHPLAAMETVPIEALEGEPFLLLEHGGKTEVSQMLERSHVHPQIRFTTWEDFAIMAMVEKGMGVGILPAMILHRIPYAIEIRPLEKPFYRAIGIAMKSRERLSPAAEKFLEYLDHRKASRNL